MFRLFFISSNKGKYNDYVQIINSLYLTENIRIQIINPEKEEAVYETFQKTAYHKLVSNIPDKIDSNDVVYFAEDSGIVIHALNGFPGVFSSHVLKTIGLNGIIKLMDDNKNRKAKFICAISYLYKGKVKTVTAQIIGKISEIPKGNQGFGYDPVFIPRGYTKTFAEDLNLKNSLSHRRLAFVKMLKQLKIMGGSNA
ncbi:MAG: non-canonical purine NTP pyrophosphatase [Candidatus Aenigmatarchaeota archaeon]